MCMSSCSIYSGMPRNERSLSASEPLSPDLVAFLRESMENQLKFDPPYVFVVFGASVSYPLTSPIILNGSGSILHTTLAFLTLT